MFLESAVVQQISRNVIGRSPTFHYEIHFLCANSHIYSLHILNFVSTLLTLDIKAFLAKE
jgi:hypothetical protein